MQKLSTFIAANKGHTVFDGHVVLIFDECHRSQFGDMHTAITKAFKRYNLFGFTGTPIFAENAGSGGNPASENYRAGVRREATHVHDR
ncbi:MAG: DEAD/DEAH box helicase family protein [Galbitalea sp.]